MDILSALWPYIDRAGAVAAIILAWQLIKSEKERVAIQKQRDEDTAASIMRERTMTQVVERNTAAMNNQAVILQAVINAKVAGGDPRLVQSVPASAGE